MVELDWQVIIGFLGLIVVIVGGVIARDRAITNMIHTNHDENTKAIKDGDDALHERVNRTREEVSNGYVRRSDLDGHLGRIEARVAELRQDMKDERRETNARLDVILAAVNNGKTDK